MKILSLHVVSFGKLKDFKVDFASGLNVLQNRNGAGKTTLANFIRAMLYGFTKSKSGDKVNDAVRYAPWNGDGLFGGSMVVEQSGRQYRIERFFGKTASKERCSVTDVKTAKAVDFGGMSAGEYLLGLTSESYDRSAYYPQEAVEISANDNFEQKLANLVENGAEDYNSVQKRLYEYKKKLRLNKGLGGKLYDLQTEKVKLQRQLADSRNKEERNKEIVKRLAEIKDEQSKTESELKNVRTAKEKLQKEIAQNQPSAEQLEVRSRLAALKEKLARIPQEFAYDKTRLDDLERKISDVKDDVKPIVQPSNAKYIAIVAALAAVCVIGAVVYFLTLSTPLAIGLSAALAAVCAVAITLLTVFFRRKRITTLPAGERDSLISEYYQIASKYAYVSNLGYDEARRTVWQAYSDYQGDLRARDELEKAVVPDLWDVTESEDKLAEISEAETQLNGRQIALSQEKGALTEERKNLSFDSVAIQDKILQTEEEYAKEQHNYDVASKTEELLAIAKDNLSTSYLPKLRGRCAQLLTQVTGKEYQVSVDRTFSVSLVENGQIKPIAEFSRGIREITLLCFRIALSELLYDGEILFIIVDDAFVNYDEENFVRATELIKQLAKCGQVIYFTCHDRLGALKK